jgi:hypothetical protein
MTHWEVKQVHPQRIITMKNLPVLIALTALAALVLLAVVSSVMASVPFVPVATYIVSAACPLGLVGMFIGDYTRRAPQVDLSPEEVRETRFAPGHRETREVAPVVPMDVLSTMGIRNDPATLTYS